MAQYKVLTRYKDKELKKVLNVGDVAEMTVKRANDINKNGNPKNGILERVDK
ncbi:hypothetical protein [Staphylococcus pseudintermedius]|uniref:hypothetical protein n=1 Tax=Staphylococcus pseudintermedius TaxID=283734 RepID=UPI00286E3C33|nr:hypothetical protein [Staphylococcus pseudintermedius]ELV3775313.1 hypothetical protein [Staphylococcus pseudintermedius]WMZ44691.1 hypothetical protein QS415_08950 [Staphylococcus pseudintermedius]HCT0449976.1 hypothetical protein [Staphylococcus pseudintermedius]